MTEEPEYEQTSGMTQSAMRSSNLALVFLRVVEHSGHVSRAGIAQQLGMTRSTVSRLVDELISGDLVGEGEAASAGRGRPAVPLFIKPGSTFGLGMSVRLGRLAVGLVDLTSKVSASREVAADAKHLGVAGTMAELERLSRSLLEELPPTGRLIGAYVALPALVDRKAGLIVRSTPLGWEGERPANHWSLEHDGLPVALGIANDADCGAVTLLRDAHGASFIMLCGDAGVGGAIVVRGRLYLGEHGWAGEIGHVCVDPRGAPCPCGSVGCLETVVGLHALLSAARQPSLEALIHALIHGDERAQAVMRRAAGALGIALGAAINLSDVSTVRLSGHFAHLEPWLREPLHRQLAGRVVWARKTPLEVTALTDAPLRPVMGAGLAAMGPVFKDPEGWLAARAGHYHL
ncbi:MAG TPA: ROK family transcriptional regulator [Arachnia sp.]|nr:ROK family transcriptional regulator [Arachnia sp.]